MPPRTRNRKRQRSPTPPSSSSSSRSPSPQPRSTSSRRRTQIDDFDFPKIQWKVGLAVQTVKGAQMVRVDCRPSVGNVTNTLFSVDVLSPIVVTDINLNKPLKLAIAQALEGGEKNDVRKSSSSWTVEEIRETILATAAHLEGVPAGAVKEEKTTTGTPGIVLVSDGGYDNKPRVRVHSDKKYGGFEVDFADLNHIDSADVENGLELLKNDLHFTPKLEEKLKTASEDDKLTIFVALFAWNKGRKAGPAKFVETATRSQLTFTSTAGLSRYDYISLDTRVTNEFNNATYFEIHFYQRNVQASVQLRVEDIDDEEAVDEWVFKVFEKRDMGYLESLDLAGLVKFAEAERPVPKREKGGSKPVFTEPRYSLLEGYMLYLLFRAIGDTGLGSNRPRVPHEIRPKLKEWVLSLIQSRSGQQGMEHFILDGSTGVELASTSAKPIYSFCPYSALKNPPFDGVLDGIWQVVFEFSPTEPKTPLYHHLGNLQVTTTTLNDTYHRYPLPQRYITLNLLKLHKKYPDFRGQVDHVAFPILVRNEKIVRASYPNHEIPCEHWERWVMQTETYIATRETAEWLMEELGMDFATEFESIEDLLKRAPDGAVEATIEAENALFEKREPVVGSVAVRPGKLLVSASTDETKKLINEFLKWGRQAHQDILDTFNLDLTTTDDGLPAFSLTGHETTLEIIQNVAHHSYNLQISHLECYAHFVFFFVHWFTDGKKLDQVTRVSMVSYHVPTFFFMNPHLSKGAFSTSPSRNDHQSVSGSYADKHSTGFLPGTKTYSLENYHHSRANWGGDGWIGNTLWGRGSEEDGERRKDDAMRHADALVPGDHILFKPQLDNHEKKKLKKVETELISRQPEKDKKISLELLKRERARVAAGGGLV